jgi:hypothetical protein
MRTGLDLLVMGDFLIRKSEQPPLPDAEARAPRPEAD